MEKLTDAFAGNLRLLIIVAGIFAFTYINCETWSADEWRKVVADVVAVLVAAKFVPSFEQDKTRNKQ